MSRGILYIVWEGHEKRTAAVLARSIGSLKQWHPELPTHVVKHPAGASLLDKAAMADVTPFDETLFLDADTVVLGRLDYAFEKAVRHGLACTICEAPFARRYGGLGNRGDLQEWNTGVLFFTRKSAPVFERWKALAPTLDSSIRFMVGGELRRMPLNDQASFALAVEETGFLPYPLAMNWNLRPIWQKTIYGPVRIWHDYSDPPAGLRDWNEAQDREGAVLNFASL